MAGEKWSTEGQVKMCKADNSEATSIANRRGGDDLDQEIENSKRIQALSLRDINKVDLLDQCIIFS